MKSQRSYSAEFKESTVKKIINRGDRTIFSVCEELGVPLQTVTTWMQRRGKVGGVALTQRGRPMKWTGEAKLKAVIETANLSENEAGVYLRKEGLYSNQIKEWRSDIVDYFEKKPKFAKDERDAKIKDLEYEVLRKDRALAEASALLILQKKVDLIWGPKSGDEK